MYSSALASFSFQFFHWIDVNRIVHIAYHRNFSVIVLSINSLYRKQTFSLVFIVITILTTHIPPSSEKTPIYFEVKPREIRESSVSLCSLLISTRVTRSLKLSVTEMSLAIPIVWRPPVGRLDMDQPPYIATRIQLLLGYLYCKTISFLAALSGFSSFWIS